MTFFSTVVKEVNSSLPRIQDVVDQLANRSVLRMMRIVGYTAADLAGGCTRCWRPYLGQLQYSSQTTIDTIVNEMYEDDGSPSPGLDKEARDRMEMLSIRQ